METQFTTNLEGQRQRLERSRSRLVAAFAKAAEAGKQQRLATLFIRIRQTNDFLEALEKLKEELPAKPTGPRYAVSSLFLYESFKKLTADEDEQFFFITGTEIDGVLVLDQFAEFAHQKRSMMGVTADTKSTHTLLIKLESFGHRMLAHFHSHPGVGPDATFPSGTDENFQKRLEAAGHVAVMAIFSRDGFVRFIRLDHDIDLEIYGTGVEKYAANVFRLSNLDPGRRQSR